MTPVELLGKTELFSSLPAGHIQQIAGRLETRRFERGKHLVVQGEPGDSLYIIERGRVAVTIKDELFGVGVEVAQLGPGDCLGELSLLTGERRNATCTAQEETIAHRLEHSVFDAILKQAPAVQREMMGLLARRLAAVTGKQRVPFVSLGRYEPDPQLSALVPEQVVRQYSIVPVAFEDGAVTVACVDPAKLSSIDELRRYLTKVRIRPVGVSREDFDRFVERIGAVAEVAQPRTTIIEQSIRVLDAREDADRRGEMSGPEVTAMVNRIIATGVEIGASDIHVEPMREHTRVRFRIHGALEERMPPVPREAHKSLLSRFKVLAKLDITELRKPQDGRISVEVAGRAVDLRLSLIPTKLGQKLVMRILDAANSLVDLEQVVLAEKVRQMVRKMIYAPHGVVLVTGPTGSGKTTTMYSALLERRNPEINIVTVEDPVEFHLDGLSQVSIGDVEGVDFAAVLRAFLRQDPDVILVGETRDAETAKLALQAGLTGRLVFTSYHTNDCISAVVRLFEMGMEPFAMANALVGVIHQRLVRRLCAQCREPFEYHQQVLDNLVAGGVIGSNVPKLYRAKGCDACGGTGYQGRVAALEVLAINEPVSGAIARQASPEEILSAAQGGAFVPLSRYLGFLLNHGFTVPGEVLGVLPRRGG